MLFDLLLSVSGEILPYLQVNYLIITFLSSFSNVYIFVKEVSDTQKGEIIRK